MTVSPDVRHVWVELTPQLLTGEISNWAKAVNVMPSTIPAYWMSKKNIPLSASPHDLPANIGRGLLEHCVDVCHIFAIEYRLSKHIPDELWHPFSAALFDIYLTGAVGLSPELRY